jgi:hypothetical protein
LPLGGVPRGPGGFAGLRALGGPWGRAVGYLLRLAPG